jgi:probable rRNA maturation factor
MLTIEISNQQDAVSFDAARLEQAARAVLSEAGISEAQLSIAIVDDATIHALNRQYLAHDYPTDVLSFVLEQEPGRLEGEVIASAETAARVAAEYAWSADDELLLYIIHGTLHLVGHDDATDQQRATMRAQERRYLAQLGAQPRDGRADAAPPRNAERDATG